jgi:hypothetical protein
MKFTMKRFPSLSLGVTGPFRSEQITPPMTSMGELAPVSLRDCAFLVCLPCAQVRQLSRLWSVSAIPEAKSFAIFTMVS